MAISKKYLLRVVYTNDRLQRDASFAGSTGLAGKIEEFVEIPNAHIAIDKIEGDKNILLISVNIYKDATKQQLLERKQHNFVPDTSSDDTANFYVQGYGYLKTTDEFADAIDV